VKRIRVLHLVVAGDIGGAERLLVDLATRPDASHADHEVALITPNRALFAYFSAAGLTVHDRGPARENPLSYLIRSLGNADVSWLSERIRNQKIDVLHTHTFASHVLGTRAARRAKVPQLRTEHHVMHYFDASTSTFTRWAAARTDRLVAVSEYVKDVIANAMPSVAPRMSVVRNGVDTEYWSPRETREQDGPLRFAVVCRLTAWKRVDMAIEAAAKADVDLSIIGDGEDREKLETLASRLGARVTFHGFRNDPRALIADCDALLSTAKEEPLGLSVLESLSMARPVIACATGGIPEIVQDEISGFLAQIDSVDAIAKLLVRARDNRKDLRKMGIAGNEFATSHCSIETMCAGYGHVYASLTGST
jgi:glycosyltransferase involved in cell wall biosynthesis